MITLITGEIGAGKTTFALVNIIEPAFLDGRTIITDIPLVEQAWWDRFGDAVEGRVKQIDRLGPDGKPYFADPEQLERELSIQDDRQRGPVVVIDEAHNVWPSGIRKINNRKTGLPDEDCYYQRIVKTFALVRHYRAHLVVITQSPGFLFKPLFELAGESFFIENTAVLGAPNSFRAMVFRGPLPHRDLSAMKKFDRSKCDNIGYPGRPVPYDREIQKLYQTHTKSGGSSSGESPKALEARKISKSIWKNPKLIAFAVMFIIAMYFSFRNGFSLMPPALTQSKSASSKVAPLPSSAATPVASSVPDVPHPNPIADLDRMPAVDDAAAGLRLVIADRRLYHSMQWGDELVLTAYDRSGAIVWEKQPLSFVASFYGYTPVHDGCTISLLRGDVRSHVLTIPGCMPELIQRHFREGTTSAKPNPPAGPSVVAHAGSSDQSRTIEAADRASRAPVPTALGAGANPDPRTSVR